MKLSNIESLVRGAGSLDIRNPYSIGCIAVAADEDQQLAMLKRRPDESILDLLIRLDQAIEQALEYEEFIDEVNTSDNLAYFLWATR